MNESNVDSTLKNGNSKNDVLGKFSSEDIKMKSNKSGNPRKKESEMADYFICHNFSMCYLFCECAHFLRH